MKNCINDTLTECGVTAMRATSSTSKLFDIRGESRASKGDEKCFRTCVAQMLYVAKRARPDCLAAMAFLCTRVNVRNLDDY